MRISVGIPVYDKKLQMELVAALLAETSISSAAGDQLNVRFMPSCTNLAIGRNQIVKEFLSSKDDRLVFLDADVTFAPGELLKLANHPVDFVGGAYRYKESVERYPIHLLNEPREIGPNGIVEVASVPTGFLSLSRDVFEKFRFNYPGRYYGIDGQETYCYFQIPYSDGSRFERGLYTEDCYFCKEWLAIGGKIYVDPNLKLTHWDINIPYPGHFGNWMSKRIASQSKDAPAGTLNEVSA